jgi:hypothetical protein
MFEVYGKYLCIPVGSRKKGSSDNLKWRLLKLGNQAHLDLNISGHKKGRRLKIKGRRINGSKMRTE